MPEIKIYRTIPKIGDGSEDNPWRPAIHDTAKDVGVVSWKMITEYDDSFDLEITIHPGRVADVDNEVNRLKS